MWNSSRFRRRHLRNSPLPSITVWARSRRAGRRPQWRWHSGLGCGRFYPSRGSSGLCSARATVTVPSKPRQAIRLLTRARLFQVVSTVMEDRSTLLQADTRLVNNGSGVFPRPACRPRVSSPLLSATSATMAVLNIAGLLGPSVQILNNDGGGSFSVGQYFNGGLTSTDVCSRLISTEMASWIWRSSIACRFR